MTLESLLVNNGIVLVPGTYYDDKVLIARDQYLFYDSSNKGSCQSSTYRRLYSSRQVTDTTN